MCVEIVADGNARWNCCSDFRVTWLLTWSFSVRPTIEVSRWRIVGARDLNSAGYGSQRYGSPGYSVIDLRQKSKILVLWALSVEKGIRHNW